MPFRDYTGFDLDTMRIMNRVFDAALARINLDVNNPNTGKLAALIVTMVRDGERDPARLCDAAVARLQN